MNKKRTCETCEKVNSYTGRCKVLTENIKGECWAWTNDKQWARKVRKATEEYRKTRGLGI